MSCHILPETYDQQLADKVEQVRQLLALAPDMPLHVVASPRTHYRMRAEFRVWHKGDDWHYAMFDVEHKRPVFIEQCRMVTPAIEQLMQPLRHQLQAIPLLSHRLYAIDFLASSQGEVLVTLIYKTPLTDEWQAAAVSMVLPEHVMVMGRSRGKKRILVRDYVRETITLEQGASVCLHHVENAFSQPNAAVNRQMLGWVDQQLAQQGQHTAILELYGGAGNFTWVLARHARQVVMTELSNQAVAAAQAAFMQAGIDNVSIAAMDSAAVSAALSASSPQGTVLTWQEKSYAFDVLLVDPPRAGLDDATRALAQRFEQIIYISCNPTTLARDLAAWQSTHRLTAVAVFDQFPYTHHIEVGVILQRRL